MTKARDFKRMSKFVIEVGSGISTKYLIEAAFPTRWGIDDIFSLIDVGGRISHRQINELKGEK